MSNLSQMIKQLKTSWKDIDSRPQRCQWSKYFAKTSQKHTKHHTLNREGSRVQRFLLNTCLKLKGGIVNTAAVLVDSLELKGVKCPTVQILDFTGRWGGSAAGVVTIGCSGQHKVTGCSHRVVPRHPGTVWYAVQTTLNVPGYAWSY